MAFEEITRGRVGTLGAPVLQGVECCGHSQGGDERTLEDHLLGLVRTRSSQ